MMEWSEKQIGYRSDRLKDGQESDGSLVGLAFVCCVRPR